MESNSLQTHRSTFILTGTGLIILGMLAIILPGVMSLGVELLVGWLFLVSGLIQGYRSFKSQETTGFYPSLLSSFLSIVVGILLLVYPLQGMLTLTILLSVFFLLEGIFKIAFAMQVRQSEGWAWILFSGLIALAMAFIIWSGWPGTAVWVIGLLIGINMLFYGFSLLWIGLGWQDSEKI